MTEFFALLTDTGAALLADAVARKDTLKLTHMSVGDGNGKLPVPTPEQTKLIHENWRAPLNQLTIDPDDKNLVIAELLIPEDVGGWWIREIGLWDEKSNLIAVANCPETYKPLLKQGSGRLQVVRMVLAISSVDNIELKIDPSVVIATREYVDNAIAAHEKSLRHPSATTKSKGFVQLSSATDSDSETEAATPKAVKAAYDNAEGCLHKDQNGADIPDKDKFVENLGLKGAIDKATNAVQKTGDTMTGELKIGTANALRIFNAAFGLIFRRSEEFLHFIPTAEGQGENGDIGPLRPFAINLRTGAITVGHGADVSGNLTTEADATVKGFLKVNGGLSVDGMATIGKQLNANSIALGNNGNILGANSLTLGDNDTGIKWVSDGVFDVYCNNAPVFRFQNSALQSNRPLDVLGRVTPTDYGNFDVRYTRHSQGVQDVRLGAATGIGRGGNAPAGYLVSGVDGGETVNWVNARPVQKLVNSTWYNVASL
ncbi:phage tail protein [Escherichia coli]|uniref:phage tail protein n=1 Tax=Escherichia coli TaxID=562 RepID=UPI00135EF94A|nr:phage tail protein [Escherichia coli]MXF04484.1 phage tail protein [Escherichia coli]